MENVVPLHRDAHRAALQLLPWFVSGALDEADRALVDRHLTDCAECRAELAFERRLGAEIAALPTESAPAWAAMAKQLDEPVRQATRPGGTRHAAGAALPWLGWAVAAGILAVVGEQALAPPASTPSGAVYHAQASPAGRPPANIAVMFRPRTTEAQVRAILAASHVRVSDGPTAAGAWLLNAPASERTATVRSLRSWREVLTAQPVDPVGS